MDRNIWMAFLGGEKLLVIVRGPDNKRGFLYTPGQIVLIQWRKINSSGFWKGVFRRRKEGNGDVTRSVSNFHCKSGYCVIRISKDDEYLGTGGRRGMTSM